MSKKSEKIEDKKEQFHNPAKSTPEERRVNEDRESRKKAEKKERRSRRIWKGIHVLQGILFLVFLWGILSLGVLPFPVVGLIAVALVILLKIVWVLEKKGKVLSVLGKILGVLILLALLLASICCWTANGMLEAVTGAPYEEKEETESTDALGFLGSGQIFTITEDAFSIYVRDVSGDIDGNETSTNNLIATIHPQTHQVLMTTIPATYYMTIPGVSEGQKEILEQTGLYGVEASMSALENLYETDISYYIKVDYDWIGEMKEALKGGISKKFFTAIYDIVFHVSRHIRTNLTKEEVQSLLEQQFEQGGAWYLTKRVATGTLAKNTTYTDPDTSVYVMNPDTDSVSEIMDLMKRVEDGEKIKK